MTFWVNTSGSCLGCCVATLIDMAPYDLPTDGSSHRDRVTLDKWLQRMRGKRLVEVHAERLADVGDGLWIALLHRRAGVNHAVLARGRGGHHQVVHDPAVSNGAGHLWATDLARAFDHALPIGYKLVAA